MTFGLRTFFVFVVAASLSAVFCHEYFGFIDPPRRIRTIIGGIETAQQPIDYDEFRDRLGLPEGRSVPQGGIYVGVYTWKLDYGYHMGSQFDYLGDGRLLNATIYSVTDDDQIRFAWYWGNGKTIPLDEFQRNAIAR